MKNKVIELKKYRDRTNCKKTKNTFISQSVCQWMVTIADTVMTLSISICTVFCMYLAYTML